AGSLPKARTVTPAWKALALRRGFRTVAIPGSGRCIVGGEPELATPESLARVPTWRADAGPAKTAHPAITRLRPAKAAVRQSRATRDRQRPYTPECYCLGENVEGRGSGATSREGGATQDLCPAIRQRPRPGRGRDRGRRHRGLPLDLRRWSLPQPRHLPGDPVRRRGLLRLPAGLPDPA